MWPKIQRWLLIFGILVCIGTLITDIFFWSNLIFQQQISWYTPVHSWSSYCRGGHSPFWNCLTAVDLQIIIDIILLITSVWAILRIKGAKSSNDYPYAFIILILATLAAVVLLDDVSKMQNLDLYYLTTEPGQMYGK